ncbi:MAG: transposase [Gammaproteobacteria bacterium]|nr:transposase [Gammaproteobacteria bacterium]MBT5221352.1 transposase [Gammaproteobacteria bacterium]MBT5826515.1 transposase [Gammaproteobacteria bacterium]MBT5967288.1 transposase [Gammaproteobacteria bacterium]MBT6421206.1 transposase [Gammaproteobacteria bacterium]
MFEHDPSRSQKVPMRLLDGFSAYLQTDGCASYSAVSIIQPGCWDHVRRYFKDAHNAQPKAKKRKNNKPSKAGKLLSLINKLYIIEREIKEWSVDEKYQQRQEKSIPMLNQLKTIWKKANINFLKIA